MWNHNTYYHDLLLRHLPEAANCCALDVGCGLGVFAARLADYVERVDAIDVDAEAITRASTLHAAANLRFVCADFLEAGLPEAHYDFICSVASLHHMDMNSALAKMERLLRPNGVLAVLGLYRETTITDHLLSVASFPISKILRAWNRSVEEPPCPVRICQPTLTFAEIKRIAVAILPGVRLRRRLFWRYTLLWRKRGDGCIPSPSPQKTMPE